MASFIIAHLALGRVCASESRDGDWLAVFRAPQGRGVLL